MSESLIIMDLIHCCQVPTLFFSILLIKSKDSGKLVYRNLFVFL